MNPIDPWIDPAELRKLAESLLQPVPSRADSGGEAGYGETFVGYAEPQGHRSQTETPLEVAAPERPAGKEPVEAQAREALAAARQRADEGGLLTRLPTADRVEHVAAAEPPPPPVAERVVPPPPEPAAPEAAPVRPAPEQVAAARETPPERAAPAAPPAAPVDTPEPATPPAPPSPPPAARAMVRPLIERLHAYRDWLHEAVRAEAFFVSDRDGHLLFDETGSEKLHQVARTLANASHAANRQAGGAAVGSLHVKLANKRIMEVLPVTSHTGPLVLAVIVPAVLSASAVEVMGRGLQQVVDAQNA